TAGCRFALSSSSSLLHTLSLATFSPMRPSQALRLLLTLGEHFLHVIDMAMDHVTGVGRSTLNDCVVELLVLLHQHDAGLVSQRIHAANVGHHVALEHVEQTTDRVQQDGVVTGFGNSQMEARISGPLFCATDIAFTRIALLQRGKSLAETPLVDLRGP